MTKRDGCNFYFCVSMSAIHFELAASLNTDTAIMFMRNFIKRCDPPVEMISHNITNRRAAEKELRKAIRKIDFQRFQGESPQATYQMKNKPFGTLYHHLLGKNRFNCEEFFVHYPQR